MLPMLDPSDVNSESASDLSPEPEARPEGPGGCSSAESSASDSSSFAAEGLGTSVPHAYVWPTPRPT
jgi:hypothetical protein